MHPPPAGGDLPKQVRRLVSLRLQPRQGIVLRESEGRGLKARGVAWECAYTGHVFLGWVRRGESP